MTAPGRRLAYLSLETPRAGQASHTHVNAMIAALERRGWQVDRFFADRSGASGGASFAARLLSHLTIQARLLARCRSYDAVFVRGHCMAAPVALLLRLMGKRVVHEINGTSRDIAVTYPRLKPLLPVFAFLDRIQHRTASHLLAVTDALADWARAEAGHGRVTTVTNAADTGLFAPDGPRADLGGPYAVFVGGLVKWHGLATMLAAVNHPVWPEGVRLVIAGDGVEAPAVRAAASARLIYLGRREQADLPELYRGALASLVPIENPGGRSDHGVMPLKLFESMACGVPVIVSDLKGQADLVRQTGCGLVVPPGDPAALAGAVAMLATVPDMARQMGARGAADAASRHSWDARAAVVDAILRGEPAR